MSAENPTPQVEDPLLAESGEYPLGGEGAPSTEVVEAIQAAAKEAEEHQSGDADRYAPIDDGDMSQEIAAMVKRAIRRDPSARKDLFGDTKDPHLTDLSRIAAEMAVVGSDEGEAYTGSNGEVTPVQTDDQAEPRFATTRPLQDLSPKSLAPVLSYGRNKTQGSK